MMMDTKTRILKMERQRLGGCRLKTRFAWMDDAEFCQMLGVPLTGASDVMLAAVVQSGAVEDFAGVYFPKAAA
jgi:hypothetical protein